MTEQMIIEAVRAAGGPQSAQAAETAGAAQPVADPAAVSRFEAAMAAGGPQEASAVDPIPFASQATAVWRSAQANNQGLLHRIRALCDLKKTHSPSMGNLVELQYEVMNLAFQQEIVTKVADKSSNAIQTLIKNQ